MSSVFWPLHRHDEHCVYERFQLFYLGLKNATAMQNSREHRYLNDNVLEPGRIKVLLSTYAEHHQ